MAKTFNIKTINEKSFFFPQGKPGPRGLSGEDGQKGEKVMNCCGIEDILLHCRVKFGGEMQPWAPDFTADQ